MSDFLYTSVQRKKGELSKCLQSISIRNCVSIREFHGSWGSLAVGENSYCGYQPVENERYIFIVIGGPVLTYQENLFLSEANSTQATDSIFKKFLRNELNFHKDLSGPFVLLCVDKQICQIVCVTDMMMFIPVYNFFNNKELVLSSHVDVVAKILDNNITLDYVSIVDFILNDVVTYPYTAYAQIMQCAPASISKFNIFDDRVQRMPDVAYWEPIEELNFENIEHAACVLRQELQRFVMLVTAGMTEVAQFLSGGEDSRAIAGLLPSHLKRDGYLFLDSMNREGRISNQVARSYGVNLRILLRSGQHYADILPEASRLVGLGHQYSHAHSMNLHLQCDLPRYQAVFGGYFSDSLLKGIYSRKIRCFSRMHFLPSFYIKGQTRTHEVLHSAFDQEITRLITCRRRDHFERVASLRNRTAHEWFSLWPATMRATIPNVFVNRRLFRSYEPFLGCGVVKVGAGVPIEWKLNRRLFNKAMRPFLYKSRWIMHGDGLFPYYPWWMNIFLRQGVSWYRKFCRKTGIIKGNQGAWTDWNKLVKSDKWNEMYCQNKNAVSVLQNCFSKNNAVENFEYYKLSIDQKMNFLQVIYALNNL